MSPKLALALLTAACATDLAFAVKLTEIVRGLTMPVHVTSAGDDRLFIVEQRGKVRILTKGAFAAEPFLDITERVYQVEGICCEEQGLLSIAFPPDFRTKGHFYVDYVDQGNVIHVSRFKVSATDPNKADPDSEEVLLSLPHKYQNHFGGQLAFNPKDGKLYVSIGDGGGGGDPLRAAQDETQLFGKIIRMDVENGDNHPEIIALGLRNPWRFSFDRNTGDLYLGDVGDDRFEEANYAPFGKVGVNFGWSVLEGNECFRDLDCDASKYTPPLFAYGHEIGCSSTGGYVYRGTAIPELSGKYLFADFCTGDIFVSKRVDEDEWDTKRLLNAEGINISTFGQDAEGELYVADFSGGVIYKLEEGEPDQAL